ncbi:Exonuclease VII, large subunit, partial [mine drainage metagenome]
RDVLNVLRRRFALVEVELLPVPVQGKEAPAAIAAMLQHACRSGRYDVLLLTRGGGANEDLAAFNDEAVVRGVAACTVPVVTAVGHEIDFTLVDFAADLRAPTPSAAAELLVPDTVLLRTRLTRLHAQLQQPRRAGTAATGAATGCLAGAAAQPASGATSGARARTPAIPACAPAHAAAGASGPAACSRAATARPSARRHVAQSPRYRARAPRRTAGTPATGAAYTAAPAPGAA